MGGESGDKLNVHFNDNPGSTLKCAAAAEMMQLACSGVWLTDSFRVFLRSAVLGRSLLFLHFNFNCFSASAFCLLSVVKVISRQLSILK